MHIFKLRLPVLFGVMSVLVFPIAQAELLEYSFTASDGANRTLSPSAVYSNPTGNIKFALSAGIDRKVRISVVRPDGSVVNSATSHLLGATDRLTVDGKSYYGAELNLNAPSEGDYQFKAEILTSSGESVHTDLYPVTVDTTPPVISGSIQWVRHGWSYGSVDVFSNGDAGKELRLENITDQALKSAKYFTVDSQGVRREANVTFDATAGVASVPVGTAAGSGVAPEAQAEYRVGFAVTDQAGNTAEISRMSKIDRVKPAYWMEVYDSQAKVWKEYAAGMTVYENPVKIRYKRRKSDHVNFNGTDYGWADSWYDEEIGDYIYKNINLNYPQKYSYANIYTKAGGRSGIYYSWYNFTLGGGASLGPRPTGSLHYRLSDGTWVSSIIPKYSHPYTVDRVRFLPMPVHTIRKHG